MARGEIHSLSHSRPNVGHQDDLIDKMQFAHIDTFICMF